MTGGTPTPGWAKARRPVRLADGRTGRLVYWPVPAGERRTRPRRHHGGKAVVLLPSGAHVSADPTTVTTLEETP